MSSLHAKKSLGQHFLTNTYVAHDIAAAAEILPGETVVEIGPGTGVLTRELLDMKARVIAIEADDRAIPLLKETFARQITDGNLTLVHADIREFNMASLSLRAGTYKVVANIPYYLSGMLFEFFLAAAAPPSTLVFLVQKEVAIRIARDPKESLLSLSVKAYGTPIYIQTVSRGNFRPVPGVDSAILRVGEISKKRFAGLDEAIFFRILKVGLGAKRKQLVGNLTKLMPREDLEQLFQNIGLPLDVRGEDLPINTWFELARVIAAKLSPK